jgi:hypothetical protein
MDESIQANTINAGLGYYLARAQRILKWAWLSPTSRQFARFRRPRFPTLTFLRYRREHFGCIEFVKLVDQDAIRDRPCQRFEDGGVDGSDDGSTFVAAPVIVFPKKTANA